LKQDQPSEWDASWQGPTKNSEWSDNIDLTPDAIQDNVNEFKAFRNQETARSTYFHVTGPDGKSIFELVRYPV